jgi:hypothetical protein
MHPQFSVNQARFLVKEDARHRFVPPGEERFAAPVGETRARPEAGDKPAGNPSGFGRIGTKGLMKEYGDRFVCARYRYDAERKLKIKTVEIIVAREPWSGFTRKNPPNKLIALRVAYHETYMRRLMREAGGRWDKDGKVWLLPLREVRNLGLEDRIVDKKDFLLKKQGTV